MASSPYTVCDMTGGNHKEVFKRQATVLKALANESRLMIVDRLSRGECSVGELIDLVGLDQSTVSKHLAGAARPRDRE